MSRAQHRRFSQERDAAIERWLRKDVVPAYDEIVADPERRIPAATVRNDLRREYEKLIKPAN